ncbi:amino acid ABC transporter permease (plasmid) [Agrobacterium radiobacter]|uniref:Binding-protein-dependent transport systems inner membrane component n=1 Tax=Agrobacterium tumefaciens str. B6 TaxID=1183423 RepID=A0A822VDU2_AGRTU|nr:amino acid ABC transporter permease [Agrobacterium tumefaciens]MQB27784.1 amino acid ABC transporter permease [Agrobacterium tumefaciens]NTA08442.1 amino acid ABC transporter permease [Agrobacterium tumefaciens]NTB16264.1 amino acid ABC transporter permease [Agrobacterium tumefaciens]CVI25312.1 Binding-protein-dependent transport systems inner membrane component [Agrobacterium tumefaciens str. B6]SPZ49541.1 general L-amino acid ABC transporter, permease protein AapM [Agrobacterium tumefacie
MVKSSFVSRFAPSPISGALGLLFLIASGWVVWNVVDWAIIRAVFHVAGRSMCHAPEAGACWSVVANRWRLILFGLYPFDEQWRSAVACTIMVAVIVCSCSPWFWTALRLATLWVIGFLSFYMIMRGGFFGMSLVFPQQWGGLSLTLYVFASIVILGMPLAVIFALLRKSSLPLVSRTMVVIIDTVRGLPLLAVVFTFAVVLPFALPSWAAGDKLYRMIAGFTLFFACYQAEVLRGGMQAIPAGQEEAAKALGLGYWHRVANIIMPQAFRNALPPTISQCVTTLKDTTLIVIVGFFEILGSGGAAFGTAEWQFAYKEVYVFVGLVFFAFTFSLSRYGAYLERRLAARSH